MDLYVRLPRRESCSSDDALGSELLDGRSVVAERCEDLSGVFPEERAA